MENTADSSPLKPLRKEDFLIPRRKRGGFRKSSLYDSQGYDGIEQDVKVAGLPLWTPWKRTASGEEGTGEELARSADVHQRCHAVQAEESHFSGGRRWQKSLLVSIYW
jgi:hypothetical protein